MSVQAGIWQRDGGPVDRELLTRIGATAAQYGPDGEAMYHSRSFHMMYRPFHTTPESHAEVQPFVSNSGTVAAWDGRLDNREELIHNLRDTLGLDKTDGAIASAAWERWQDDAFLELKGDWALSIWTPQTQTLRLARDFMGLRDLFYYVTPQRILWCTDLGALVLNAGVKFTISEKFIAGYLAFHPDADVTPYAEIAAVLPGSVVVVYPRRMEVKRYWRFRCDRIVYKTDAQYEEHFRLLFRQSVKRRLRSDSPILAELSGGLDSSSIVCMAHDIIRLGEATTHLETVSHYGTAETEGDDRPFFMKVEDWIGKVGHHICLDPHAHLALPDGTCFRARPGGCTQRRKAVDTEHIALLRQLGGRVILSGAGGDELLGGVPDPVTPLADALYHLQLHRFSEGPSRLELEKANAPYRPPDAGTTPVSSAAPSKTLAKSRKSRDLDQPGICQTVQDGGEGVARAADLAILVSHDAFAGEITQRAYIRTFRPESALDGGLYRATLSIPGSGSDVLPRLDPLRAVVAARTAPVPYAASARRLGPSRGLASQDEGARKAPTLPDAHRGLAAGARLDGGLRMRFAWRRKFHFPEGFTQAGYPRETRVPNACFQGPWSRNVVTRTHRSRAHQAELL